MKERIIENVNRTLFELEVGILIFGVVCQIFVFLPEDKAGYSIGLWIGVITAALAAFHMWYTLDKGLDFDEKKSLTDLFKEIEKTEKVIKIFFSYWFRTCCHN